MKNFNLFYVVVILLATAGIFFFKNQTKDTLSFYGFAESNDTAINYNYPVVVKKIMVSDGNRVQKGDTLMVLARIKSKETLADQGYRISELRAQEAIWNQRKTSEKEELFISRKARLTEIDQKIESLEKERNFKISLAEKVTSIELGEENYKPLLDAINSLKAEKQLIIESYDQKELSLNKELAIGNNPYQEQIKKLKAEIIFEEEQKIQYFYVTAPAEGIIGAITCKEEEHIPSFKTLLIFYEPHSGIIKSYVHENFTAKVKLNDQFKVSSLKDPNISYLAKVTGLGSRIIETPTRLRKIPEIKSYGREILLEITKENDFLQQEKVKLTFISSSDITNE